MFGHFESWQMANYFDEKKVQFWFEFILFFFCERKRKTIGNDEPFAMFSCNLWATTIHHPSFRMNILGQRMAKSEIEKKKKNANKWMGSALNSVATKFERFTFGENERKKSINVCFSAPSNSLEHEMHSVWIVQLWLPLHNVWANNTSVRWVETKMERKKRNSQTVGKWTAFRQIVHIFSWNIIIFPFFWKSFSASVLISYIYSQAAAAATVTLSNAVTK